MQLLNYSQDRLPVVLFLLYFALDLLVYFTVESPTLLLAWLLTGILPKAFICSFNHHHQHVPTFRQAPLNRLLELMFGFQTGVVSNGWVLHHVLGHHQNYLDQTLDESRWKRKDGTRMKEFEYALVVAATAYPRALAVGRRFPDLQKTFLLMSSLTILLLALLFWHNWLNALLVFALPMSISLLITAWHTYYHHSGLDTDDEFLASFNILDPCYNLLTCNLGYHTAHHLLPGLHWSRLPEAHARLAEKIPAELYRSPPPPLSWLSRLTTNFPRWSSEGSGAAGGG